MRQQDGFRFDSHTFFMQLKLLIVYAKTQNDKKDETANAFSESCAKA